MRNPQSTVLTKNLENASAPAAVCFVASMGMTGGRSDGLVTFGPVRGTSAGTVGTVGFGRRAVVVVAADVVGVGVVRAVVAVAVLRVEVLVFVVCAGTDVLVTPVVDTVAGGYVVSSAAGFDAEVQAVKAPAATQPARMSERVRTKIPMRNIVPKQTLCA